MRTWETHIGVIAVDRLNKALANSPEMPHIVQAVRAIKHQKDRLFRTLKPSLHFYFPGNIFSGFSITTQLLYHQQSLISTLIFEMFSIQDFLNSQY